MTKRIAFTTGFLLTSIVFLLDYSQGYRYPWSDEWDFVPVLTGDTPVTVNWLWEQHNEHRIVIPKLVYLLSFRTWPDFRLPILVVTALMGVTSLIMMSGLQKLRAGSQWFQLFFPMLLLDMALGYHAWGFHVQFASSTVLLCLFLSTIACSQTNGGPFLAGLPALTRAAVAVLLPLCGMNGVIPALVIVPYLMFRGGHQASCSTVPKAGLYGKVTLSSSIVAALTTCMIFVGYKPAPHPWGAPSAFQLLFTTMHVLSAPLNLGSCRFLAGIAIGSLAVCTVIRIMVDLRAHFRSAGKLDWCKVDLLVFVCALLGLAVGVGWGRGGRGWAEGLDGHYSLLMVPLLCGLFIGCLLHKWRKVEFVMWTTVCIMFCVHGADAIKASSHKGDQFRKIDRTIEAGAKVDEVVSLHIKDLFFLDNEHARTAVRNGLRSLHKYYIRHPIPGSIAELND